MQKQIRIVSLSYRFEISFIDTSESHLYRINCYFYESLLIFTFRYYSQSLDIIHKIFDTLFLRARKCFLLIINVFLRYYNHRYYNFQSFFVTFIFKQCLSKQRLISFSQFINCLKRFHARVSQSIACISNLTKSFFSNIYT